MVRGMDKRKSLNMGEMDNRKEMDWWWAECIET